MITAKGVTDVLSAVTAFEPDIALALSAYTMLKGIWNTINPGKTEADFQAYLQASSQTNIDTTAQYLRTQGYVENPEGSGIWAKPNSPA